MFLPPVSPQRSSAIQISSLSEKNELLKGYDYMELLRVSIEGNPFEKGFAQQARSPLSLRDISPHCGESPSNSLPKTSNEKSFNRVYDPIEGFLVESLWKEVWGDSLRGREMSEGQRVGAPVGRNLSSERFAPVDTYNTSV